MAGSSLIALIDDIATVLDDVAMLTKVAAKKTAGVLGDDLALNAHMVGGVKADRELPVVWAVAKGSAVNKAIIVPAALAFSALVPWAVTPLLMVGGAFLCYEAFEKIAHKRLRDSSEDTAARAELEEALSDFAADPVQFEQQKIKGAIRTDFILSAEIVTIALGTVAASPFVTRVVVLFGIAVLMTVGVYGLVGGIVKLDDLGLSLSRVSGGTLGARMCRQLGAGILKIAPYLMKGLSIAGTAAMFLVGGGILTHGIPLVHRWVEGLPDLAAALPIIGALLDASAPLLADALFGVAVGGVVVIGVRGVQRLHAMRDADCSDPD